MSETSKTRIPRECIDAVDRAAARTRLRALRATLDAATRQAADEAIGAALDRVVLEHAPRILALYWPLSGEPDLRARFEGWHARGVRVVLPRVTRRDAPLDFVRWTPKVSMEEGPYRTQHPAGAGGEQPDALVLPCLGFDARGYRLGYGGGYYDRTLARLPGSLAMGVAYDRCELEGFVPHAHDHRLHWIVTERRTIRC